MNDNNQPELSIVTVTRARHKAVGRCLRALQHASLLTAAGIPTQPHTEVLVVDRFGWGQARNPLAREFPTAQVLHSAESMSAARAVNLGLAQARGAYVLLLAPEVVVLPGAVRSLLERLKDTPYAAAAGPRFFDSDGTVLRRPRRDQAFHRGLAAPEEALRFTHDDLWLRSGPVEWLSSACLLLRARALHEIGPLDEAFGLVFGEADWCRRARAAGWELHVSEDASARCTEPPDELVPPETIETLAAPDARWRYFRKHHGVLGALAAEVAVRTRFAVSA